MAMILGRMARTDGGKKNPAGAGLGWWVWQSGVTKNMGMPTC